MRVRESSEDKGGEGRLGNLGGERVSSGHQRREELTLIELRTLLERCCQRHCSSVFTTTTTGRITQTVN